MLPSRLHHRVLRFLHANRPARSARNIQYHYDLSNDLYQLFLDDSLTYSCAVFEPADLSLAQAQTRKIDQICRRLELRPGLALLEIGSGWGAFAIHAARHYGCRVTSLTLSRQQLELARERVAAAGLEAAVDIRLCDYREISGSFDRIVSIEMFEAVGYEYYRVFFEQCDRLLRPGGRMFLQTITVPDQRFERYRREFDWIRKYIFPGGLLASAHAIATALMRYTDLRIEWMQDIGPHYARTLRCWRERFLARRAEVDRLGFDERFHRMWEFYLASCEAAFATRHIGDVQMLLRRPAAGTAS
jgi:cyclopropane-fatty-acyl-phospholipid synthase